MRSTTFFLSAVMLTSGALAAPSPDFPTNPPPTGPNLWLPDGPIVIHRGPAGTAYEEGFGEQFFTVSDDEQTFEMGTTLRVKDDAESSARITAAQESPISSINRTSDISPFVYIHGVVDVDFSQTRADDQTENVPLTHLGLTITPSFNGKEGVALNVCITDKDGKTEERNGTDTLSVDLPLDLTALSVRTAECDETVDVQFHDGHPYKVEYGSGPNTPLVTGNVTIEVQFCNNSPA